MSDKVALNARRVSINANQRLSMLSVGDETTQGRNTLGGSLVASRKMSAVDSTARASIMRNKIDTNDLPEETTEAELKGYVTKDIYRVGS